MGHNELWKILKEMGIPDTLPASWEICMQVKKQQLELDMEQWTGLKLGNENVKAVYCHFTYLTSMQSISCEMLSWMNHELESWLPGEISVTSDNADTTLMTESKEKLKSLLMKVKDESEKPCLKLNIQKINTMASSPISSWQIDGEKIIFLGSKITADGDCSHEIKRHLLLGSKTVTNLDSILKSRDITLPTKVCLIKAMVFPVVTYGYES